MPSQTFIRREIAALEERGVAVRRFTLRRHDDSVVDPDDLAEARRTRAVLDVGAPRAALAVARCALGSPRAFLGAVTLAVRLGHRSARGLPVHLAYLAEACILLPWLRAAGATHVHAHFGTNATTVALLCRRLGGPPYSFTVHGPEEFDRPEGLKLGEKVAAAAFVVAISDFARSQLFRWCRHQDWSKVHVVRCGLDPASLDSPPLPVPAAPRLVHVGRFSEQKGQLLLVEAVARVLAWGADVQLVMVGDGPMRGEVEALVAATGTGRAITLTGVLDNGGVREEMAAARATVLASFAEGLPVVLMESLALGRPVITTDVAGIPELVEDGVNGWLVPPGSVDALAKAMQEVVQADPSEVEARGRAGWEVVRQRHDVRREAASLEELVRRSGDGDGAGDEAA
jgi:glycosyltransferase involved in cell wall biosynthesis